MKRPNLKYAEAIGKLNKSYDAQAAKINEAIARTPNLVNPDFYKPAGHQTPMKTTNNMEKIKRQLLRKFRAGTSKGELLNIVAILAQANGLTDTEEELLQDRIEFLFNEIPDNHQ